MAKLREKDVMAAETMKEHGQSVRSLARALGVDESSLRYRLKRRREGAEDGRRRQAEACSGLADVIERWLSDQAERVAVGRRPEGVVSLYEGLVSEHGFEGSYKSVLRYVRRRQGRPRIRAKRRVEVRPGSQAQVDWLQAKVHVASLGGKVKLWAFVMVLSASRMWTVVWSRRKDLESWLRCHNEAFSRLDGVPLSVRPDNEKTAVEVGAGPWGRVNEEYQSYANQLGFIVNVTLPRHPQGKGKVERRCRDVRWTQVREGECFADVESLQRVADERIAARAKQLRCSQTGTSVFEAWQLERLALKPLPETLPRPFDVEVTRVVSRDCLVSFEARQYSVGFKHAGRTVRVRGCGDEVEILVGVDVVKRYPRGTVQRLLIDQADYEGESTDEVIAPMPLGELGRRIVLERSWEAPRRAIDHYAALVGGAR